MVGKKALYKTKSVKSEYISYILQLMYDIQKKKRCDIRDVTHLEIFRQDKLNRKTFYNNFRSVSGIHEAVSEDMKRQLWSSLGIDGMVAPPLNEIILIKALTELKNKRMVIDYTIESCDNLFWLTCGEALGPVLQNVWPKLSQNAYDISTDMFSAVLANLVIRWSQKKYDNSYKPEIARLLIQYAKGIGQLNRDFPLSSDSPSILD